MQTLTIDRTKSWTAQDFTELGEIDRPCQLINGELIMSPAPGLRHQRVSKAIFRLLDKAAREIGEVFYAPVDVYVGKLDVYQPDLLFVSKANHHYFTAKGLEGPPDLIVEVISPGNSYLDRYQKKEAYQHFGVKEYWIVDPGNETLEVYKGAHWDQPWLYLAASGMVSSTVLPTLSFDLAEVWQRP